MWCKSQPFKIYKKSPQLPYKNPQHALPQKGLICIHSYKVNYSAKGTDKNIFILCNLSLITGKINLLLLLGAYRHILRNQGFKVSNIQTHIAEIWAYQSAFFFIMRACLVYYILKVCGWTIICSIRCLGHIDIFWEIKIWKFQTFRLILPNFGPTKELLFIMIACLVYYTLRVCGWTLINSMQLVYYIIK